MDKVLVTGATGFIGSELIKKLDAKGYAVEVLERYVTGRYAFGKSSNYVMHYANLTDYPAVRNIIRESQPDYVVHLAALSAVSFSYEHFIEVSETNYLGTINLAEACHREVNHFKQFLFAGTSEEYGVTLKRKEGERLTEDSPLSPNSPYAVSKVAGDLYLKYMHMAYKFPYTVLRPFNTYGRKGNKHFFIESVVSQMLKQDKVYLGDPDAVRDWLYVDDHVDGYVRALGNEKAIGHEIQLCTGRSYTTRETAELIAELTGFKGQIIWNATPKRPLDAFVLMGDNSKAKDLLGWEPQTNLEEGLKKLIGHLKAQGN
jgi:nucleoside-diphosphate-sugar epimerase